MAHRQAVALILAFGLGCGGIHRGKERTDGAFVVLVGASLRVDMSSSDMAFSPIPGSVDSPAPAAMAGDLLATHPDLNESPDMETANQVCNCLGWCHTAPPHCSNGQLDVGLEAGVDCGGPDCEGCPDGTECDTLWWGNANWHLNCGSCQCSPTTNGGAYICCGQTGPCP